ncbi:MAG: BatB protein [Gammaproteobacteria bacterium]|nr:MAG: BatB protein [Gammaproteobacteria bacterium]RLA11956.1 MAG: BatB protein [Gammaproteobacteria bacterium]
MLTFVWPLAALALPLPWLMRMLLPTARGNQLRALRVPFAAAMVGEGNSAAKISTTQWLLWIAALAWLLLVVATCRPQWLGEPVEIPISGRDMLLAVDLSGSMEVEDFRLNGQEVDRLQATKAVASQFIERRQGDRLGLILFGEQAYLQVPLTFDRTTVNTLLDEAVIGLAGKATAIGDAIGLAVKRLRQQPEADKVLILLTDGANTAGVVEPLQAAQLAAQEGLKIYTVGIGADEMIVRSFFGNRRVNPSTELDEKTLTTIAEQTGGQYFRARDTEQMAAIYDLLDQLEPTVKEQQLFRPKTALYPWPLGAALALSALILAIRQWKP